MERTFNFEVGIANLAGEEFGKNKIKLLNLGPKFVPTESRQRPHMGIIQTTETCALDLEREGKFSITGSLQQNIRRIITKDLKKKYENKLSFAERNALTEMKHGKSISIYPFVKETGFVVIKEVDGIQKIQEKTGKSKIIDHDPAPTLLNKFQKDLAKLRTNKQKNKQKLTTKHVLNSIHLMLYYHDYMELLKSKNQRKTIL